MIFLPLGRQGRVAGQALEDDGNCCSAYSLHALESCRNCWGIRGIPPLLTMSTRGNSNHEVKENSIVCWAEYGLARLCTRKDTILINYNFNQSFFSIQSFIRDFFWEILSRSRMSFLHPLPKTHTLTLTQTETQAMLMYIKPEHKKNRFFQHKNSSAGDDDNK